MGIRTVSLMIGGATLLLATLLRGSGDGRLAARGPFTNESSILAISREDQTEALKTKAIRKEVTLGNAITVLTTYRQVTRDEYLRFAHQIGARGTVTTKDHGVCLWSIEPDYAAVITLHGGGQVYLLR